MATFYAKGKIYATVVATFVSEEKATEFSAVSLETMRWVLLSTYLSKCIARVKIGRIQPRVNVEWLVAAVFKRMKQEIRVLQAIRIKQINWCGYGLEMIVQSTQSDLNEIAEAINLPEEAKSVVLVERTPPKCYSCGKEGKIKTTFTQHVQENQTVKITTETQDHETTETELRARSQYLDKESTK